MNINNKIVIRRGVKFEDPGASALSFNAFTIGDVFAQEFVFLKKQTAGDIELSAANVLAATGGDDVIKLIKNTTRNLAICYQGAEEPYNQPNVSASLTIPAAMQDLLKPASLFVRASDAIIMFDPTKLIEKSVANGSTIGISAFVVGEVLILESVTGSVRAAVVGPTTVLTATQVAIGLINKVDTTNPNFPMVEVIC